MGNCTHVQEFMFNYFAKLPGAVLVLQACALLVVVVALYSVVVLLFFNRDLH